MKRLRWISVSVWIGVIFFSSTSTAWLLCESAYAYLSQLIFSGLRDSTSDGLLHFAADKGLHVTLFAVLALLLYWAMLNGSRKILRILLFGLVIGSCSEYLQSFFPDRDPAVRDVFINLAGTGLGAALGHVIARSLSERRSKFSEPGMAQEPAAGVLKSER